MAGGSGQEQSCGSLKFSGSGPKFRVDWDEIVGTEPNLTAEAWIKWDGLADGESASHYLTHSTYSGGLGAVWLTQGVPGQWIHLARVHDSESETQRNYINGVLDYENDEYPGGCCGFTQLTLGGQGLHIGGSAAGDRTWRGLIQGFRISSEALYHGDNFTPPTSYGSDENTLVYLPLTKGEIPDQESGPYGFSVDVLNASGISVGDDGPYCSD